MTRAQLFMLKFLRAELKEAESLGEDVTSEMLSQLADEANKQKILPLLVDSMHLTVTSECFPDYEKYKRIIKSQMLEQARRAQEFFEIYEKLRESGLFALVVKGCVCRTTWPKGELRLSADEDIYVQPEGFENACEALKSFGLTAVGHADISTDFEIGWRKPDSLLYIELHRKLFAPDSGATGDLQRFFDCAFDRAREYHVGHGTAKVWSMSPDDHLLYLILHAYKHFIHSGFGIRQVYDIGLWAKQYLTEIDYDRLANNLKEAHALCFAATVFAIARDDLGIDLYLPDSMFDNTVDREPMLQDLLNGGIYGNSTKSRQHAAPMIVEAVSACREKRNKAGLFQRAFPSRQKMLRDFPELKEHPKRLPLIWLKRLSKYRKETMNDADNSVLDSIRIAKERERMLKYYHVI